MIYKEACVETIEEALLAEKNGAQRLEFCGDLSADGLTPPFEQVKDLLKQIAIPVKVMIRSRAGNFCYNEEEIKILLQSIEDFKKIPVAGFVAGLLDENHKVDAIGMKRLVQAADGLPITFHKAIDLVADKIEALAVLKTISGIDSVLTSGGAPTALQGAETLQEMISFAGKKLTIIAAGKVTYQNLKELDQLIGAPEYHGRRIVPGVGK